MDYFLLACGLIVGGFLSLALLCFVSSGWNHCRYGHYNQGDAESSTCPFCQSFLGGWLNFYYNPHKQEIRSLRKMLWRLKLADPNAPGISEKIRACSAQLKELQEWQPAFGPSPQELLAEADSVMANVEASLAGQNTTTLPRAVSAGTEDTPTLPRVAEQ